MGGEDDHFHCRFSEFKVKRGNLMQKSEAVRNKGLKLERPIGRKMGVEILESCS